MQSHDEHVSTWLHCFNPLDSPLILDPFGELPVVSALESHQHVSGYRQSGLPRWVCTLLCPLCKWDTRSLRLRLGLVLLPDIPISSRCLTRRLFNVDFSTVDSSTGQFIILSDQLIHFMCSPTHLNAVSGFQNANKYGFSFSSILVTGTDEFFVG